MQTTSTESSDVALAEQRAHQSLDRLEGALSRLADKIDETMTPVRRVMDYARTTKRSALVAKDRVRTGASSAMSYNRDFVTAARREPVKYAVPIVTLLGIAGLVALFMNRSRTTNVPAFDEVVGFEGIIVDDGVPI